MDRSTSLWLGVVSFGLLGAVALVSCVPHIEEDIAARAGEAVGFPPWLEIDVDGQELVLRGEAPGPEAHRDVLDRLDGLVGVTVLHDAMSIAAASDLPAGAAEAASDRPADEPAGGTGDTVAQAEPIDVPVVVPRVDIAQAAPRADAEPVATAEALVGPDPSASEVLQCQEVLDGLLEGQRINFAFGSVRLAEDSRELLREIAGQVAGCAVHIEISGHTDSSGQPAHNRMLSRQRAESVVKFLVAEGVEASRLSAVGYGDSRPIASNDTRRGRRANRRIEFRAMNEPSGDVDSRAERDTDA